MGNASCAPTEYVCFEQTGQSVPDCPDQAHAKPSVFCAATGSEGWHVIRYDDAMKEAEDDLDIMESLEALKEPPGVSLDDLRRELDA